ncbi:hypothetical protein Daus18300_005095 [Diaporthe australafricana]|uniref:Uncharacterized protein n=1 Tax=Diaporthe australafricana TaxID=127596 RepID=A0ABR3X4K2_9PEZI
MSCTESEWPESDDQIVEMALALEARKDLLLDGTRAIFDRFVDCLTHSFMAEWLDDHEDDVLNLSEGL